MLKLATFRGVTEEGEPLNRIFRPGDSIKKVAGTMMPEVQQWLSSYKSEPGKVAVLVNALGATEYWGQNVNGDIFPESALLHDCRNHPSKAHPVDDFTGKIIPPYGYWTFLSAHPFVHHRNKDPMRAFGKVVLACWNPRMHRVELIIILDKELAMQHGAQHVIDRILAGEYPDCSMGCFQEGTRILMSDGTLRPIEDVVEGDEILTHLGEPRRVTSTMVREHDDSIFRLKAYGHPEVLVTGEHPLWLVRKDQVECRPSSKDVNRGRKQRVCSPESRLIKKGCEGCSTRPFYEFEWIRADEADEGDYLASPVPKFETDAGFSMDEARLLGYYLAEGHLLFTKAGNLRGIQFSTGMDEKHVHDDLQALAERLGLEENFSFANVPERNGCYISLWGAPELADMCATHCGSGSKRKRLSIDLMGQSPDVLKAFLGAYANGDGGAYKGSLYLSTASKVLSGHLAAVAMRCGMIPSVSTIHHKPGPNSVVNVETVEYRVWIGTDTSWKMDGFTAREVSRSKKASSKRFFIEKNDTTWLLTPIESIDEEEYHDRVYNFSVEGHESYVAEGLAVHNCRVPFDVCTICEHKSKTRKDYCNCIRLFGMNKILDDGRQIGVINTYPRFFDISFVFIGADKTAKVMCKLGMAQTESGLWVPQSVLDAEELYGEDNEDGIDLVKAASVQVPRNFLYLKEAQTNVTTGAGIGGVDLVADDIAKGPVEPKLLLSKEDKQENEERRAIADGTLKTNADVNETDEFPTPLYPYNSGAQTKVGNNEEETKGPAPSAKQVADFLKKNPKPSDEQFHGWAESHGFNVHKAEAVAYQLASEAVKTAQISDIEHYGSMKRVWEAAKNIKIGPPPKPNRKEYPFTGTIDFRGLMIHVENKPGTYREGKGWRTLMRVPYGEFLGTRGVDKDKLDVYVGPYRNAPNVFIIHQNHVRGPKKGKYDEDKVMVGFESPDQAQQVYLAHYDSPKYLRSITTMAFPLFKRAIMKKEVHGEKIASELTQELEKIAVDLKLEDLFATHKTAQRRERSWKKSDGLLTKSIGSGMDDWDQVKTASIKSETQQVVEDNWQHIVKEFGQEKEKRAAPLEPLELLKISNEPKTSSQLKWADIVKEIGPGKAVGKVSPMLSDSEPDLPRDTLNEMGGSGLERGLSTPSMMGMVLKPREFQRVCLSGMGREGLADKLDDAGAVFKPSDQEAAPCGSLSPGHVLGSLIQKLMPHLREKSYFGPPLRQRIIRITISRPESQQEDTQVDSPLLSKVSAAYNWYRREQMKLAGEAMEVVPKIPELHAAIYGIDPEHLFGKTAAEIPKINPKTLAVVLGAVPLTLMYSAHARGKRRQGKELGMFGNLMADHPWLATLATSVALKKIMDTPQAQQAVEELFAASKRVAGGKETTPHVLV